MLVPQFNVCRGSSVVEHSPDTSNLGLILVISYSKLGEFGKSPVLNRTIASQAEDGLKFLRKV